MPIVATGIIVDAIAIANVETVAGAVAPDGVLREAWNGDVRSLNAAMLQGLARFIRIYGTKVRRSQLVAVLRSYKPDDLCVRASTVAKALHVSLANAVCTAIFDAYNRGRHKENRLAAKAAMLESRGFTQEKAKRAEPGQLPGITAS